MSSNGQTEGFSARVGISSDGPDGLVGRGRRLGHCGGLGLARDGRAVSGPLGGARARRGKQARRVQFDGVVVGRRRARYRLVVGRLLLEAFVVGWHRYYMDGIVDLVRISGARRGRAGRSSGRLQPAAHGRADEERAGHDAGDAHVAHRLRVLLRQPEPVD